MAKIDFSIALRGSSPIVRNFTGVNFDTLVRWLRPGDKWDGVEQPPYMTERTQPYDHKTYNGYLSSVFTPISKTGDAIRSSGQNPQPGYRNAANVMHRSLIMLDFDALPLGSLKAVQRELYAENVLGVLYTTYNHLNKEKGGLERFRAVIVTDRNMSASELPEATYSFFDLLKSRIPDLAIDTHSLNPAFAMYRPPANSNVLVFDQGEPMSVDGLLADFDEYQLTLPVKARTAGGWEPATAEEMELCQDWLDWADDNRLTVSEGQIWVCCPQHARHTTGSKGDGTDGGAVILLPNHKKGQATFKCLHSQCDQDVNRNQRDTMLDISEGVDFEIPDHLLPDPHGGTLEEDLAAMRAGMRQPRQEAQWEEVDDEDDVPASGGLQRQRIRKEGAVDGKDLPHLIGGTIMIEINKPEITRLAALREQYSFVVQGGRAVYFARQIHPETKKANWFKWEQQTMRDVLAHQPGVLGFFMKGQEVKWKTVSLFDAYHHWAGKPCFMRGAAIFPPPTKPEPEMLNTWEGFAVDPVHADVTPFVDYLREVLCSGEAKLAHYFTQWLAHMVQKPGTKPGVAIVMRSGEGNGKGQLAKLLDRILGALFMQYNGTEKLTGQFNISLMTTLCAFVDEAKAKGQENATIRGLVTESLAVFEGKGSDSIKGQSFARLIFASNEAVLKITKGDRRYCVLSLDPRYAANDDNPERERFAIPYWEEYSNWVKQEWVPSAVLAYLMDYSLDGFDAFNAPKTKAHKDLVADGLTPLEEWFLWQATDNKFKPGAVASRPKDLILLPGVLAGLFADYMKEKGMRDFRTPLAINRDIGKLMRKIGVERIDLGARTAAENRYCYLFASQDDLYLDLCDALGVNPEYD